jgi:predicted unusual protein kinase regulating ubiquinone biosynthesis (AarF/ABC1/UbiB family)
LRAGLRGTLARWRSYVTVEPTAGAPDAAEIAGARELARAGDELRGGVAKVAQLAGYRAGPGGVVETESRLALGRLYEAASAEEAGVVARVIEEELGAPPPQLFHHWQAEPTAAASLGQVHAAEGSDGERYAVKVQYPGMAAAMHDDLASPLLLRRLAGAELRGPLEPSAEAALRQALLDELDYAREAAMMTRFAAAFAGDGRIRVPRSFPSLSSARVLTMERIDGVGLGDVAAGADELRAQVAQLALHFAWEAEFQHHLLHGDPNPGNYRVLPGPPPVLCVLDHGGAVELAPELVAAERVLWSALLRPDPIERAERFRAALLAAGLLASPRHAHLEVYRDWEAALAAPILARGEFHWSPSYAHSLATLSGAVVRTGVLRLPGQYLLLWRYRLGLAAVLAALDPRFDVRAVLVAALRS